MACKTIHMWTLSALVGAFLDLAIAYLLLCASTTTYFASKFLSIFGLSLPCPCNGLFGHLNSNSKCVQRALVESPLQKISSLHVSVGSKRPFDLVPISGRNSEVHSYLWKKNVQEIPEDEASCSSYLEKRLEHSLLRNENDLHFGVLDSYISKEGNLAVNKKQRQGLRWRRRSSLQYRQFPSISSRDSILPDSHYSSFPLSTVNSEDKTGSSDCNDMQHECYRETPEDKETSSGVTLQEKISFGFGSNKSIDESSEMLEEVSAVEEFPCDGSAEIGISHSYENEKDIIGALERALEEQQVAYANQCLELEKERSAAATAADEAMCMILRLQEEKASIELEARQFQRMIEEKSAFDAEEMSIMTEILLRREKEKYFLEKEVESYRQMIISNEQLDSDLEDTAATQGQGVCSIQSSTEDPELMLRRISFAQVDIGSQDAGTPVIYAVSSVNDQNCPLSFRELQVPTVDAQLNVSTNNPSFDQHDIHEKAVKQAGDELEKSDYTISSEDMVSKTKQPLGIPQVCNSSRSSNIVPENDKKGLYINRSSSDILGSKTNGRAQLQNSSSSLRRNSMSAFDYERMKIDSEVGWLRERLKLVQKGRQRLNFAAVSPEGGKTHLQLLEDIAVQLRKIRQLRDPGKDVHQASLPPLSSKDMSKRRHWRSPSLEDHRSS